MPTFTSDDALILALGLLAPNAQQTLGKIHDAINNWAWSRFCQCDNGTAPPAVVIAPPQGTTNPDSSISGPCFTGAYNGLPPVTPDSAFPSDWQDITLPFIGADTRRHTRTDPDGTLTLYGVPAGTSSVSFLGTLPGSTGLGCSGGWATINVTTYDATGAQVASHDLVSVSSSAGLCQIQGNFAVTSSDIYWRAAAILHTGNYGTIEGVMNFSSQVWCGGGGPGVTLNCCPPDPSIALAIQNILNFLQNQVVKTPAYKLGNVHSGLTGTGTLTVSGLFGVKFALTAGVPTQIQFPGVPAYERSVGWCSILTGDGMIDEVRITRQNQVWASALAPYATTVGYQLNPGFSMDLTELLPA